MPITNYTKAQIDSTTSSTTSGASKVGVSGITGLLSGAATNVQAALAGLLALMVPTTRNINTTSGHLTGGGDLSADRTLGLPSVVSAGSATLASVTVDAQGRVTSLASGSAGAVPDASTTVKGASKLSVAPTSSTNPIAVGDNDSRMLQRGQAVFYMSGTLTVKTGVGKHKLPTGSTVTIAEVTIEVDTLPTGASVIADVNSVNNTSNAKTSLYTTQANRPTVAAGGNYSNVATLPDTTSLSGGISLSVDCDQIGSTAAGADLVIIVRYTY